MGAPPVHISEFHNSIKNSEYELLEQLPNFFTSQTAIYSYNDIKSLISMDDRPRHMSSYKEQFLCFDFTDRCAMWPNCPRMFDTDKHYHSKPARPGFAVNDFPGLYFLPQLFEYRQTQLKLIDAIMHEELTSVANLTNLDADYHRSYPYSGRVKGLSYLDVESSGCSFRPRNSSAPTDYPLTPREFVDNLRWLKFGECPGIQHPSALAAPFKQLVDNILKLPVDVHAATAYMSSSEETTELRQHDTESEHFVHVCLGCDVIVVIGSDVPRQDDNDSNHQTGENAIKTMLEFDTDDNTCSPITPDGKRKAETGLPHEKLKAAKPAHPLVAIHMQQGDSLVFTGDSRLAWHGVAKVLKGNDSWENEWPCTPNYETGDNCGRWRWKGCMKGRSIDLVAW